MAAAAPTKAAAAAKAFHQPLRPPARLSFPQSTHRTSKTSDRLPATRAAQPSLPQPSLAVFGDHPAYGGYCTLCGGHHALQCTQEAVAAMQHLLAAIFQHQRLDPPAPGDPRFTLDYLFTRGPGRMLGVMLAADGQGQQHVLKAFSGQITESWHIPGWVGPVAGIINESPVYVRTRQVIEGMSARMHRLEQQQQQQQQECATPPATDKLAARRRPPTAATFQQQQRQLLKRRRRCLSHHLLQQIQQSYATSTVAGAQLSLLEVYMSYREQCDPTVPVTRAGQGFVGMPAGVGDCCAPKLLHAAAQRRLTPVTMCEVWCGSAPGTATKAKQGRAVPAGGLQPDSSRQHCRLYGPCEKCCAILGTMLCGLSV